MDTLAGFALTTMKNEPLVSVVIPTYNRAGMISQTIDNVFQQTYRNLELIVVDDGSTDDTQDMLRQYGDRIRVVIQANSGPAVARNRGVEVARGEIIAFQDSDDLWKPAKLARQVALLVKAGTSVPCCLCNAEMGIVNGKALTSFDYSLIRPPQEEGLWLNVGDVLATRFVLFNQSVAIRRAAFEKLGGFDETLKYLEDYDLPLRLALEGPWAFIREPLVIYSGASAGSFSQQGLNDPITLKQCELTIFRRVLDLIEGSERHATMRTYLNRRVKRFRRGLRQTKLSRMNFAGARSIAALIGKLTRYEDAFFRRSPWFPRMLTAPVEVTRWPR
jgi:glycosyltransferase involved in cell wall biosynthesis